MQAAMSADGKRSAIGFSEKSAFDALCSSREASGAAFGMAPKGAMGNGALAEDGMFAGFSLKSRRMPAYEGRGGRAGVTGEAGRECKPRIVHLRPTFGPRES